MAGARTGPLLLIIATIGGWVLLRSLFVLLSAPMTGLPHQPVFSAESGEFDSVFPPPLLPRSIAALPTPVTPQPRASLPSSTRQSQSLAMLARAFRPSPAIPAATMEAPRNSAVVAAQALLLDRMQAYRPHAARTPAYGSLALTSAGPLARFIPARRPPEDRWSLSAGLFIRSGDSRGGGPRTSLSPGSPLGGTQGWARLGWRPGPAGTEIFARANSAGRLGDGAEAAIGIAHRPVAGLPVQLVAERRQRIGAEGRSAFAAYAVGGTSATMRGWRLDGYGAAGVVGASRRDAFAEGSATLARPVARLGPVELSAGGGAWGAAQPGVERLDIGPRLTARSDRLDGARLALDWRQRVAGNATPNSGPALTLSVDF